MTIYETRKWVGAELVPTYYSNLKKACLAEGLDNAEYHRIYRLLQKSDRAEYEKGTVTLIFERHEVQ